VRAGSCESPVWVTWGAPPGRLLPTPHQLISSERGRGREGGTRTEQWPPTGKGALGNEALEMCVWPLDVTVPAQRPPEQPQWRTPFPHRAQGESREMAHLRGGLKEFSGGLLESLWSVLTEGVTQGSSQWQCSLAHTNLSAKITSSTCLLEMNHP
jgi:hypothetical protein